MPKNKNPKPPFQADKPAFPGASRKLRRTKAAQAHQPGLRSQLRGGRGMQMRITQPNKSKGH